MVKTVLKGSSRTPAAPPPSAVPEAIGHWAERRFHSDPEGLMVFALDASLPPRQRLQALKRIKDHLLRFGLLPERVRYTADPVQRAPAPSALPGAAMAARRVRWNAAPMGEVHLRWLNADEARQASLALCPIGELIADPSIEESPCSTAR